MEITGSHRIPASRETVWEALNDPDVLRRCIPGCESLEVLDDGTMTAVVVTKIGPVKARFNGSVAFEDVVPPEGYRIGGEGKGGIAGFAKGSADVNLTEDVDATVLDYKVDVQVGGKIAQLGSRLIVSSARKLSDQFFSCFVENVG